MTTTMAALECQSKPNHMTRMGATPTMGSAATRLPSGSSPRRRKGTRSQRMATRKPESEPMIQPGITARSTVCTKSTQRMGSDVMSLAQMSDGAGSSTAGTLKPFTISLPEDQHGDPEERRIDEICRLKAPLPHGRAPMRFSVMRSTTPTSQTRPAARKEPMNSAAQICTVCP